MVMQAKIIPKMSMMAADYPTATINDLSSFLSQGLLQMPHRKAYVDKAMLCYAVDILEIASGCYTCKSTPRHTASVVIPSHTNLIF